MSGTQASEADRLVALATQIHNEQRKLRANAFDRLSSAVATVGVVTPVIGTIYRTTIDRPALFYMAASVVALFFALIFHTVAYRILRGLR